MIGLFKDILVALVILANPLQIYNGIFIVNLLVERDIIPVVDFANAVVVRSFPHCVTPSFFPLPDADAPLMYPPHPTAVKNVLLIHTPPHPIAVKGDPPMVPSPTRATVRSLPNSLL